jgi:uncharacterized membrane protein YgcG
MAMPRLRRGLVFLLFAFAAVLPAAARELTIQHFDAKITVNADGTVDVTEIIEARFTGEWHGIYRTIPVEYTTPQGFNYTLFLDVLGVADDDGKPLKYEISREGAYRKLKIYVPGAVDSTRTVIVRYHVLDGLKFFQDHDELYWNVTGDEWEVPIVNATAHIELPSAATGIHAAVYTGRFGAREQDADVTTNANAIDVAMRRPLAFHEGLTAVVGWDKGVVHEPGPLAHSWLFLQSNWPLMIPIVAFIGMFSLWWTQGRDPRRLAIAVQYEPPDGLTPGEAGTLVDNEAAMRDITATIVDLAVRGFLVIEQTQEDKLLGLMHNKEYVFHMQKPPAEWAAAKPHEVEILGALFEGGSRDSVKLSELQNHFYTHLPAIRDRIFDALMADNYYLHRPDKVRQGYVTVGLVLGVGMVWGGAVLARMFGVAQLTVIVAGVATGIVVCGFGYFMPARTITGARTLEKVLGFEDFLGRVEEDRFERVVKTPQMFEKFLPYAMALHVEKKWVAAFADIYREPPNWYRGPYGGAFTPYFLVNDLDMMSARAGTVMASSPRSSGGSGFGGGGFSGGGFGGGGGGGF